MEGLLRSETRSVAGIVLAFAIVFFALAPSAHAATLFSDGFESGSMSAWSSVRAGGGGGAWVQSQVVHGGSYAARLSATSDSSSYAYARKSLPSAQTELTVAADVRIQSAGSSGNVPLVRLFDADGTRLISLFRQNSDWDKLYVRHSGAYNSTSGTLALNTWARLELTVRTAGTASTVIAKLNGTVIHHTTAASLGTAGVRTVQLGNDTYGQPFDLAADNVVTTTAEETASSSSGCVPTAPAPANSDPGTVVVADNFEGGLGRWTVVQEGDARVSTQTQTIRSGGCAGRISVTTRWDSRAHLRRALPYGTREVWADGWFNFEAQGTSTSWNLPTFRMFSDSKRVLDVSRQNGSGSLFVRYPNGWGWTIRELGIYLSLKRWYHVRIHAIANWSQSAVEVWLDGSRIFATTYATLGTGKLTSQMVGADHATQEGVVAVDDVIVKARS